jgi:uncharacterized protein (DUF427 family)
MNKAATGMKIPGPDHPITISQNGGRVRVTFAGRVIADSTHALRLAEASYKPVLYVPRRDADMSALRSTDHHTHCPYKGDASYFSIVTDDRTAANAVWSYEQPFPAMAQIKDYLAFFPDRVDKIEEV